MPVRTARTGRSTSSTSASAATRSASRWWQEYQVPVHWTHLPAGVRAARPRVPLHGAASRAGRSTRCRSTGLHLPARLRAARPRVPLHGLQAGAGRSTRCRCTGRTCRPVYEQHVCEVPVSLLPHRDGAAAAGLQDVHLRAGLDGAVRTRSAPGDWQDEQELLPRPGRDQVLPACRAPGSSTPAPARRTTALARSSATQVQCPGHWVCKRVWVPREEVRTVRCCHYVQQEHCHVVNYTSARSVPYTVMKQVPYTTCKMVRRGALPDA